MSQVNVTAYLVFALLLVPDEDNSSHSAVSYQLFSLR
jgi:hypothetical protein